jgi:hypothetical protein
LTPQVALLLLLVVVQLLQEAGQRPLLPQPLRQLLQTPLLLLVLLLLLLMWQLGLGVPQHLGPGYLRPYQLPPWARQTQPRAHTQPCG